MDSKMKHSKSQPEIQLEEEEGSGKDPLKNGEGEEHGKKGEELNGEESKNNG
jgi:hypothetical protein